MDFLQTQARKMLKLLDYTDNLKLLTIENVSKDDEIFPDSSDTFLGVDTVEYYGGKNYNSAEKIRIVQVKYRALSPTSDWTLKRLSKTINRKIFTDA